VKRVRTAVATQLAVDDESFLVPAPPAAPPAPVRFIGMGRLLHWKGFHLALRALAASGLGEAAELWLLGDGPERGRLEAEARALGVDRRARFLGEVTRTEALARLGECHVLVHPSLHDTSPSVLNEAMAAGRPIVCLALGGPAVQVTDATGIRVPATDVEGAVRGLAEGMRSLAASPELRARMGEAARALARERTWDARAREVRRWYDELCGSGNGHGHGHGHDGGNRCA
jgi:glycosyltransferase involved in cell wall biosynthesis